MSEETWHGYMYPTTQDFTKKNLWETQSFTKYFTSAYICASAWSANSYLQCPLLRKCSMSAGTLTYCIECSVKPANLWRRKPWMLSRTTINSNTDLVYSLYKFQLFNLQKWKIRPVSFNDVNSFILYW